MFIFSCFFDTYSAYVDTIDTSRNNVDIFYKYKHVVVHRPWRTEVRAGYTKVVHF
jgi:hypothetical protein